MMTTVTKVHCMIFVAINCIRRIPPLFDCFHKETKSPLGLFAILLVQEQCSPIVMLASSRLRGLLSFHVSSHVSKKVPCQDAVLCVHSNTA